MGGKAHHHCAIFCDCIQDCDNVIFEMQGPAKAEDLQKGNSMVIESGLYRHLEVHSNSKGGRQRSNLYAMRKCNYHEDEQTFFREPKRFGALYSLYLGPSNGTPRCKLALVTCDG